MARPRLPALLVAVYGTAVDLKNRRGLAVVVVRSGRAAWGCTPVGCK